MTEEDQQHSPIEEAGGYGTPTVEQEMPGGETKKFAQPREEEAFDAAGLSQDTPDGETYPAGAPDLSQFGAEDQDSAGEPGAGRLGGTEEQVNAETDSTDPGFEPVPRDPGSSPGQPTPERSPIPTDPDIKPVPAHPDDIPQPRDPDAATPSGLEDAGEDDPGAAVPSADAEMDESNTEDPDAGRPFSSEPTGDAAGLKGDAAGLPDGSGTDLPGDKSPRDRDDDGETFDAG